MGNAVAPATNKTPATIDGLLRGEAFKQAVSAALPTHIKPDRFVRIALTALTRTPKLRECEQSSFFQSLLTLSQFGLEPDGRRAHLIPFKNTKRGVVECVLIIDFKGMAELVRRGGNVGPIYAREVRENDSFEYENGVVHHKINFKSPRGRIYAFCAQVTFKDGTQQGDVMTLDEVESVRQRSRAKNDGPWAAFPEILKGDPPLTPSISDAIEMGKKSVFRRLTKLLDLSPEVRSLIEADDAQYNLRHPVSPSLPSALTLDQIAELQTTDVHPEAENQEAEPCK